MPIVPVHERPQQWEGLRYLTAHQAARITSAMAERITSAMAELNKLSSCTKTQQHRNLHNS